MLNRAKLEAIDVRRLADDTREKIMANADIIQRSKGQIVIEIFPKGTGFDIRLKVTT